MTDLNNVTGATEFKLHFAKSAEIHFQFTIHVKQAPIN